MTGVSTDPVLREQALNFLTRLKNSTNEQHQLLESNFLLSSIIKPGVTKRQYYIYLRLMNEIEIVLESRILPQVKSVLPMNESKNCSMINHDLKDMQYTASESLVVRRFFLSNENLTVCFALGLTYVMKGSKLGGKIIFKNLHRYLGVSADFGAKYISDYGVDTFNSWKEFLFLFSNYVVRNKCENEAIEAVKSTFLSVYDYFESNKALYGI